MYVCMVLVTFRDDAHCQGSHAACEGIRVLSCAQGSVWGDYRLVAVTHVVDMAATNFFTHYNQSSSGHLNCTASHVQ